MCTVLGTGLSAGSALAQGDQAAKADSANQCNPNAVPTQALAKATFSMQRAFQNINRQKALANGTAPADTAASKGDNKDDKAAALPVDPAKDLRDAIGYLTTPPSKDEAGDSVGRAYYLGQAYILLLQQPGVPEQAPRATYGIATDSSATIDLLAAADTQFTKVETSAPACRAEMAKWREQQPWLDALNGAINALNSQQFDSAEALAKRSLLIDHATPYPYTILASVSNNRKDYDAAIGYLKQAIATAEASHDTTYNESRINAMYDLANTESLRADATAGPEKMDRVKEAIAAWQTFMPVGLRDVQVANAVQMIRKLLRSVDDTTSYEQSYSVILQDPSHYGEAALLNAGLVATQAKHSDDAVKLFSAVLEHNPNQRDALNNLAASYVGTKEYDKMFPYIDRLVSLDPNNADNWLLYAYAYTGLLKGTKDPKLVKSYTDSLIKYNGKAEKLNTRVTLSNFSHTQHETTLSGSIENRAKTAKSYTMQVDFLDASGNVLGTQSVNVGPVAPQTTEPFTVTLKDQDAVAFRYKPL
jgi:tetratricopeptide (TPR) repeat protein